MQNVIDRLAGFDPFDRPRGEHDATAARRYVVADVFTDTPLEGNGLGVFTDARGLSTERMQRLARELNLSEPVFLLPARERKPVVDRVPGTHRPLRRRFRKTAATQRPA